MLQKTFLVISWLFVLSATAEAVVPEYSTYLRAGSGSNVKGGAQECINNQGSWGNEFRLGNECGIYGEFQITGHLIKKENPQSPYWKLFSDFAFVYDNKKTWEESNPRNWVLTELYTEAGNVDGMNFSAWAGKRYYRWGDVHMMDFYPVNFSGPGGGIGDISMGSGVFYAAIIQNAGSDEIHGTGHVSTEIGSAAKTSLHLRWEQVASDYGQWSFWLVGATTSATDNNNGTTEYKSSSGGFFAFKNNLSWGSFNNEFGMALGQSNLSNMGSHGELAIDCNVSTQVACNVDRSTRWRAWESLHYEGSKWSGQMAIIYDEYDKGISEDSKVRWASFGVRPTYWFTDHVSLAFQAGISNIVDESDGYGSRNLGRLAVAPQISMGKGYYSRPVLRAFYARTFWNENNKVSAAGTSAAKDLSADTMGFQTEVWF